MFRHELALTVNFRDMFARVKKKPQTSLSKVCHSKSSNVTQLKEVRDLNLAFNSIFGFSENLHRQSSNSVSRLKLSVNCGDTFKP